MRPCLERGCPELTTGTYCKRHAQKAEERRKAAGGTGRRGTSGEWRRRRGEALRRDSRRCQRCGSRGPLEVHHIDGDPSNNELANLITLCETCHKAAGDRLRCQNLTSAHDPRA